MIVKHGGMCDPHKKPIEATRDETACSKNAFQRGFRAADTLQILGSSARKTSAFCTHLTGLQIYL